MGDGLCRRKPRGSSSTGDSGVPGVTARVGVAAPDDATLRAGLPATGAAKSPKFNALQKLNGATASGPAGGETA